MYKTVKCIELRQPCGLQNYIFNSWRWMGKRLSGCCFLLQQPLYSLLQLILVIEIPHHLDKFIFCLLKSLG